MHTGNAIDLLAVGGVDAGYLTKRLEQIEQCTLLPLQLRKALQTFLHYHAVGINLEILLVIHSERRPHRGQGLAERSLRHGLHTCAKCSITGSSSR
jgi:hypothetical protein